MMERIEAGRRGFRSLTEAIDTTTPAGRMMMQMVGAFAEFERAMIRERTSAGLAQARTRAGSAAGVPNSGKSSARKSPKACFPGGRSGAEMARLYRCQPADGVPHRQRASHKGNGR